MKELLGFVGSLVLSCDYSLIDHMLRCVEERVSDEQFFEALNVALVVGGSITIPRLRLSMEHLEEHCNLENCK